jgi:hypothetical protein
VLDIAPATYRRPVDFDGVLVCEGPGWSVAGIIDGFGSWGYGVEAASWLAERLLPAWRSRPSLAAADIADSVSAVASQLPREWQEEEMGCSCSMAIVLKAAGGTHVVAAGLYSIAMLGAGQIHDVFRARLWINEPVRQGLLTADEAQTHPLRHVVVGPFVADADGRPPDVLGPFELPAQARFLIADDRLLREVIAMPADSRPQTAIGIQEIGRSIRVVGTPVVLAW